VLIVTLDTARADRFSYAGPSPVTTAACDAVAAEGAAFLAAVAPSPITLVSHASLLTGQNPPTHGVRNNGDFALGPEALTLAEMFADRGWATAAFVGASVLDSRYGLDQGFGVYDDAIPATDASGMFAYPRRRGDEVVAAALRWLDAAPPGPSFVWVHLYDPHAPYDPPEPERSRFRESPYDGAVAYTDRMVGTLLDGYRRLGRYERALVVITSDHGESLGEHGEKTHGVFVYDATVRVPLVMRGPGVTGGVREEGQVGLIDVMPTVLALTGVPIPPQMEGRDLGDVIRGGASNDDQRAVYVESLLPLLNYGWSPLHGLRTAKWKFIRGAAPELYDLEEDPAEQRDLVRTRAEVADRFSSELAATLDDERSTPADRLEVDEAERSRLAALGYVSFVGDQAAADARRDLPDPRERIHVMERMYDAMTRFADGDVGGAMADLEALVAAEPDNFSAWASLAELRFRVGDFAQAASAWGSAARLAPRNPRYSELEGLALERIDRLEAALAACDRALAVAPDRASSRELRWRLLARLERHEELVPELERVVADEPGNGMARLLLIQVTHGREPPAELVRPLEAALADIPGDLALTAGLAAAVLATGDGERAEGLYRQVLAERPGEFNASLVVGERALAAGHIREARQICEAGVRKNPDRAAMQVMAARARMADGDIAGAREALVRAYHLQPGWAPTWLAAGELGILEGLTDQAAANLDRAAAAAGDDPDLWRRLADANRRLGREREAAAAADRAQRGG
jgi:arylsulfatase A-like enzyme/predicted Zn-dependent protease